ncbi:MAG TPA: hypothetical protein VJY35_10845 [Candidatus Eisenbacteria bacterium]|nr:hypothetical protein [Candidatus Eisenbacteria bacterium]
MRHTRGIVRLVLIAGLVVMTVVSWRLNQTDPIAFSGHGVAFDREGLPIDITPEFIEQAQGMYLYALSSLATGSQRASLADQSSKLLEGRTWDRQSKLIARSALIDWFLDEIDPLQKLEDVRGKNKLLRWYLQWNLEGAAKGTPFVPAGHLTHLLDAMPVNPNRITVETPLADKLKYIEECKACGVPIPPDWGPANVGPGKWEKVAPELPREKNFLWSAGTGYVEVYKYTSTDPVGLCIALPRAPDATGDIRLLGIICVGKASSRACFWDNQRDGTSFLIDRTVNYPLTDFDGGPGLKLGTHKGPGMCTACHAGENAYIVHPGTALATASEFSDDWYKPMVDPSWPQNPGPGDQLNGVPPGNPPASPGDGCLNCHFKPSDGGDGRFPVVSRKINYSGGPPPPPPPAPDYNAYDGYAFILRRSTSPDGTYGPMTTFTMPPSGQGRFPNHTAELLGKRNEKRPIPAFTINGRNPKACDFAFIFCPPPANLVADGTISDDWGEATEYRWGYCKTAAVGAPCQDFTEMPGPFNQKTRDFGNLAPGSYRIQLKMVVGTTFTEIREWDVLLQNPGACTPTPTALALVSAEVRDGAVHLMWSAPGSGVFGATVQRRTDANEWADLASVSSDGDGRIAFSDRDVTRGIRYGYRLAVDEGGSRSFVAETWVNVPGATAFALAPPRPSPASGDVTVSFSLPVAGGVRLEVVDVAGRTLSSRAFASLGPGWHDVRAAEAGALPAGVYFVRLTRTDAGAARDSRTARLLIVR